jgi:outer membrane protein TolC
MTFENSRCRRFGAVAMAVMAGALAGCAVGPDFKAPDAPETKGYTEDGIPDARIPNSKEQQQAFALDQKISGEWWQLLHAERLNPIVTQAIVGNQDLAAARATLAQAQEVVLQARGVLYPQLDLAGGVSRQATSLAAIGQNVKSPVTNLFTIGPTVSYSLDPFGANRRRVEQQGALAEVQDYQLDAAYLTLTGNAVTQALTIASTRADQGGRDHHQG